MILALKFCYKKCKWYIFPSSLYFIPVFYFFVKNIVSEIGLCSLENVCFEWPFYSESLEVKAAALTCTYFSASPPSSQLHHRCVFQCLIVHNQRNKGTAEWSLTPSEFNNYYLLRYPEKLLNLKALSCRTSLRSATVPEFFHWKREIATQTDT